jgi:hypothetical protein
VSPASLGPAPPPPAARRAVPESPSVPPTPFPVAPPEPPRE